MNLLGLVRSVTPARKPSFVQRLRTYLSPLLFWGAIVLPLLYLPLLATGIDTITHLGTLLALLLLHFFCILAGHSYTPG
jgi:hypothetical protein